MKSTHLALVLRTSKKSDPTPELIEVISDGQEIELFESALATAVDAPNHDPLEIVYAKRETERREEEEFGDYVEKLLSQPGVRPEVMEHGVRWFRSKQKIEDFRRAEAEAASVIAGYALEIYGRDPSETEFVLAGPRSQIEVKIYILGGQSSSDRQAA